MPQSPRIGPVIGIGSSAGGLESMQQLIPRLRANGTTRYIIAQHLAKSGHSELVTRVLGRTSGLPVIEAHDNDVVAPDCLYLIPPDHNGVVQGGRLRLQTPPAGQLSTPSVNVLFNSIAEDAGSNGVGVILSGAGSDGLLGCRAIKERGGKVFVQSAETALIDGMPGAIRRAGIADEILSPLTIADRVNDLVLFNAALSRSAAATDPSSASPELRAIIQEVSNAARIDFSSYKEETLLRRVLGRMKALGIEDLPSYVARARSDPAELAVLKHLFVVSLSWFFRDRRAFDKLSEYLAEYLAGRTAGEPVRVWVPGCATGEECFSLAILLTELAAQRGLQSSVEVVGSDLNPEALDIARQGFYPANALKEFDTVVPIAKWFVATGGGYQVADHIRSMCSFRNEDIIAAAAPRDLDLVSCRNFLIYLKSELQELMVSKFARALRSNGLLFLGLSENIGRSGVIHFSAVDPSLRIFQRRPGSATDRR